MCCGINYLQLLDLYHTRIIHLNPLLSVAEHILHYLGTPDDQIILLPNEDDWMTDNMSFGTA
jgi:hypothetical protein